MKKYFFNLYLILKNINNYGFFTFIYASIVELFYLFKFRDFYSYIHDNSVTSDYFDTKIKNNYNTQHTPTPYYFLSLACSFVKKLNYEDFIVVDMGSGLGRVGKFFLNKFNCSFYGLEINKIFVKKLNRFSKKNKKFKVYNVDLKNKKLRNEILSEIKKQNKKIIIFFSDPFDIGTILNILKFFKKKEHIVIGVNVNYLNKLFTCYKIEFSKFFKNKLRHVVLLTKK